MNYIMADEPVLTTAVKNTVAHLTTSTLDVMLNTNTMLDTTGIITSTTDALNNQNNNSSPVFTSTTTEIPSTTIHTPTEHTEFPSFMLGITAACAFIIAILGTCGK